MPTKTDVRAGQTSTPQDPVVSSPGTAPLTPQPPLASVYGTAPPVAAPQPPTLPITGAATCGCKH
jgi:hypothetical protein